MLISKVYKLVLRLDFFIPNTDMIYSKKKKSHPPRRAILKNFEEKAHTR